MDSELTEFVVVYVILFLIISGLLYLAIGSWRGCRRDKKKAEEMRSWPQTTALATDWVVSKKESLTDPSHYATWVTYGYQLNDKAYSINLCENTFDFPKYDRNVNNRLKAKRAAKELGKSIVKEKKRIQIYYNPDNTSESMLELREFSCVPISVVVIVLSCFFLIFISAPIVLLVMLGYSIFTGKL